MDSKSNKGMEYNPNVLDDIPARLAEIERNKPKNVVVTPVEINDIRVPSDFRGFSFSEFKKTEVRNQLVNSMLKGKVEPACYWSAELICAGHLGDLWEIIINYMAKHIHLGNPKLAIYLKMRYENFRNIMMQGIHVSELEVRNDDKIRKLFSEVICTLTLSNKKPSIEPIKINREEEYDITQMTDKLKAPTMDYAQPIFQQKDPRELFIALNEFAYYLSKDGNNMLSACYWVEWTIEFNLICKKRKEPIKCVRRPQYKVESKFQSDVIWLIWDVIMNITEKQTDKLVKMTMDALLRLFCIKYSSASGKKRRYLLYYAISLLTETITSDVELVSNREILQNVTNQIDDIYKQIKKNEHAPKTEYLFNGLDKKRALEKSLKQMELLGELDKTTRI
jgi:hypothetical protein